MDAARKDTDGTIVTAMCRNGYEFGIRIAGMGDEWFTAPVNTPQGLYFTGYSADDANFVGCYGSCVWGDFCLVGNANGVAPNAKTGRFYFGNGWN